MFFKFINIYQHDYDPTTENETPWEDKGIDHDDDDEEETNTTQPFTPGAASTPYQPQGATAGPYHDGEAHEMRNFNLEDLFKFEPDDIPPVEVDYIDEDEMKRLIEQGKRYIKDKFRNVDFTKLGPIGFGRKSENKCELVRYGAKGGEDRIFKKNRSGLLKSFIDKAKNALGPSSEELLAKENQEVREAQQRLKEAEEQLKEEEKNALAKQKSAENVQNLRNRLKQVQARRDALQEEHGSNLENQNEIKRLNQLEKILK